MRLNHARNCCDDCLESTHLCADTAKFVLSLSVVFAGMSSEYRLEMAGPAGTCLARQRTDRRRCVKWTTLWSVCLHRFPVRRVVGGTVFRLPK